MPLYKGKGNREECNNYRGISLLSVPGKIYGRILNEKLMKITDKSVGDEQGGFGRGRGCVDQIFAMKILVEKYLEKDRKLFAALWTWRRLREYGVGGQLLEGVRSYENASASVWVNGELSEGFNVEMGVRQGCMMLPWLFIIYTDGCMKEMKCIVGNTGSKLRLNGEVCTCVSHFIFHFSPAPIHKNIKQPW